MNEIELSEYFENEINRNGGMLEVFRLGTDTTLDQVDELKKCILNTRDLFLKNTHINKEIYYRIFFLYNTLRTSLAHWSKDDRCWPKPLDAELVSELMLLFTDTLCGDI